MENKINIAELLKDCPSGMELDCTLFEGVEFDSIVDNEFLPIRCRIKNPDGGYNVYNFTKYGCWLDTTFAKCIIFPKGKTTWEGFHRQFKDGDIVCYLDAIAIFKEWGDETLIRTHVAKYLNVDSIIDVAVPLFGKSIKREIRLATEEEKAKLFKAIKDNGYEWNPESKTLKKLPRFKIGNKIKKKGLNTTKYLEITDITPNIYIFRDGSFQYIKIIDKDYELIPNKFDITTLVPFESRVLVRSVDEGLWKPAIYGFSHQNGYYVVGGACWKQCIPYKDNEYLCGTTNACNNFYKTWEE